MRSEGHLGVLARLGGALLAAAVAGASWLVFAGDGKDPAEVGEPIAEVGLVSPDAPIHHVVFIIKENRTFDHNFGRYPDADGATRGRTLRCTSSGCMTGDTIPLGPAPDVQPHDITHGFASGLYAINGGRMNGFNIIGGGRDLTGYVQHSRESIPAYWAYADRFVLADAFFTSMYGPTFPEHLFTVAAQSFGIVDNPSGEDAGSCDNRLRVPKFPNGLSEEDISRIIELEDGITEEIPEQLERIQEYWERTISCFDIEVPPDQLERGGRDQLEVLREPEHVHERAPGRGARSVRAHVEEGRAPRELPPRRAGRRSAAGLVARPARGAERAPRRRRRRLRGRELDRPPPERDHAEPNVGLHRRGRRLGRLRRFYDHVPPPHIDEMGLGPRTPALIVSPYTVAGDNPDGGAIDSTSYEFSSVLAFIERLHRLDPMTERDAAADPLSGAFDFGEDPRAETLILSQRECPN